MANTLFAAMSLDELIRLIKTSIKEELNQFTNLIPQPQPEKLLSIEEAARFLHVSKVTIHKWKKKKLIHSHRIGRKVYFKENELLDSLKSITIKK